MVSKSQTCVGLRLEQAIEEILEETTRTFGDVVTKVIGTCSVVDVKTIGSVFDHKAVCRVVAVVAVCGDDVLVVVAVVVVVVGWVIVVFVVGWIFVVVVVGWVVVVVIVVCWVVVAVIVMVGSLNSKECKRILFVFYAVIT